MKIIEAYGVIFTKCLLESRKLSTRNSWSNFIVVWEKILQWTNSIELNLVFTSLATDNLLPLAAYVFTRKWWYHDVNIIKLLHWMHTHSEHVLVNCTDKGIHVSKSPSWHIPPPAQSPSWARCLLQYFCHHPLSSVRGIGIYTDKSYWGGDQTELSNQAQKTGALVLQTSSANLECIAIK